MSTSIQSLKSYADPPSAQPQTGDVFSQIGSHTEVSRFVASPNVEMLWNIIVQNAAFKVAAGADDTRSKLRQHYITHLKQYVETVVRAQTKSSLIDLNKSFIAEFIKGFRETSPPVQRLDLTNTASAGNGMITIEELKAERLSNFDNQYDKMQTDFDQYRVTEAVTDTKFADNTVVEPLKNQDMEDMLSRTVQTRTEQENASVPRNVNETQRARDWLNLGGAGAPANASEVIQPHPEKKSVSFLPDLSVISDPPAPKPPAQDQLQLNVQVSSPEPLVSPMNALQTRMTAMETKLEEMHAMISGMVATVPAVVGTEEKVVNDGNDNSEDVSQPIEPMELSSLSP
jgi:hypothetical protein